MAKKQKPKVLVALTGQRLIFSRTAFALINAAVNAKTYEFDFYMEMGADIASSRNRIVEAAKERGATHLLFVDYDMYFSPQAIERLIEQDKDIIGAAYNFRTPENPRSTAVPLGKESAVHPDELPTELFKAEILGAGLLLIKMSVFDKMEKPYFMWGYTPNGDLNYGEDTYFCQIAQKRYGIEVWADPTLGVKHVGEHLF